MDMVKETKYNKCVKKVRKKLFHSGKKLISESQKEIVSHDEEEPSKNDEEESSNQKLNRLARTKTLKIQEMARKRGI